MNQVTLSSDQFVLLTLLLKLGVMAGLATLLVSFSSFKNILFREPGLPFRDVKISLLLALIFAAGVTLRIMMDWWAVDLSLPGGLLIGLLTGVWPGMLAGALIALPAILHGEFLALPLFALCGLAGGLLKAGIRDASGIWNFSPLPLVSPYRAARTVVLERRIEGRLLVFFVCLGLDMVHYFVSSYSQDLLFDLRPDSAGVILCRFLATLSILGIPLKIWNNSRLERQLEQREVHLLEARFRALKNQINPHFLFNTLNSISSCLWNDPKQARRILLKLSEILRRLLHSEQDFVPLSTELDFIDNYLEIETIRFGEEKLSVRRKIDARVLDVPVPGMILQPFVENALKHGIAPMLEGGLLTITAAPADGLLTVILEDNGAGIRDDYTQRGIGIQNVIARLNMVYGPGDWCRITSLEGRGTRVEIRFPLKERVMFEAEK